ncbi:MAG: nucleoside kinase [Firmicutes bacterium]|jgi:uridine kinase|nr:nucleoside kinase [Bacillota bacterium]NLO66352.1 nucleoside kinase [Bacillota bacterium]
MKESMITVSLGRRKLEVARGTLVGDLAAMAPEAKDAVVARVDNDVMGFQFPLMRDCWVEFLTPHSEEGMRAYRASLVFLFVRAALEVLPDSVVHIKHSLNNGLYGEIEYKEPVIERHIIQIEARMRELVAEDVPFERRTVSLEEARRIYGEQGFEDKLRLLEYYPGDEVTLYSFGWLHDYLSSVLVPSAGVLQHFKLRYYLPGFILEYPRRVDPYRLQEYVEQGKLFNVFFQTGKWQENLGIPDAASLNDCIKQGGFKELVHVSEAYHENQISEIAKQIARDRDRLRVILIAGPSSSGKTTFAQRLSVQLRVEGLQPVAIGLDDYFVDRHLTPRDEDGIVDFEALEAIDIELFNEHLTKLIQGDEVEIPTFDFMTGSRKWNGRRLQVRVDQPIIIEGIHGLNDKLTASIPKGRKFKIYISALTNLNLDNHTRISTTDVRMLRRMVRDAQFRAHDAKATIDRWPLVTRGEHRHIFPFQEDADAMFNSTLIYELAVLKPFAEKLLREITPEDRQYAAAQRLLRFLSHFIPATDLDVIPCNSILREFIGGSCFA